MGRLSPGHRKLFVLLVLSVVWNSSVHAGEVLVQVNPKIVLRNDLPAELFGFNIHQLHFQRDFWKNQEVDQRIVPALVELQGAIYRYPGGLLANGFSWEDAVGSRRQPQKQVRWSGPVAASFGVVEYADFVQSVGGRPWYVLNLSGWDREAIVGELPTMRIAESNAKLAELLKRSMGPSSAPIYYELGNELDRADYEWSHDKYITRSAASIAAIRKVDPTARFVAFVRDFDWTYKRDDRLGEVSRAEDLIQDVLRHLPEINDIALHSYYDDPGMEDRKPKQIPWRLRHFQRAINIAKRERAGGKINVWITEHARGVNMSLPKPSTRAPLTSNLRGAVSSADFLLSAAKIPEVKGAALHGLNASPWQSFDATIDHGDLRPRPTVLALQVLKKMDRSRMLLNSTTGPNESGYPGGYDVNVASFGDDDDRRLGFWAVNRANTARMVTYRVPGWENRRVSVRHVFLAGEKGADPDVRASEKFVDLDPEAYPDAFDHLGGIQIELSPLSVSSILIDRE